MFYEDKMMRKVSLVFFLILSGYGKVATGAECQDQPSTFEYSNYHSEMVLYLTDMATLPGEVVFLGGHYHDGTTTVHPALFISWDSGKSWKKSDFSFENSSIQNLQTYGLLNIWALITLRQEGLSNPEYLIRSTDAGKNWCILPLAPLNTLGQVDKIEFFDAFHGFMTLSSIFSDNIYAYYTQDSGTTWRQLWGGRKTPFIDMETDYRYPDSITPPNNAPLWKSENDYHKIIGILRFRQEKETEDYVIERYDYYSKEPKWNKISTIPSHYRVIKNHLTPQVQ